MDAPSAWRKSTRSSSQGQNCVEATAGRTVAVRDSKDPDGSTLAVDRRGWESFTAAIRSGRF